MPVRSRIASIAPRTLAASLLLAGALGVEGAAAQEFCSTPLMPYCLNQFSDFRSTMEIDRCQETLNSKLKEVKDYRDCTAAKANDMQEEIKEGLKKLKQARDNFEATSE